MPALRGRQLRMRRDRGPAKIDPNRLEVGKLASLLAVTFTPQKDINIRLPVGGPCFVLGGLSRPSWFFLSSFSLGR